MIKISGGYFNCKDSGLKSEIFGWTDKPENVFEDREISELTWDLLDLIHDYDWYRCGDTGRDSWIKSKAKFKKKWFGNRDDLIRKTIDKSLNDLKKELYETYLENGDE